MRRFPIKRIGRKQKDKIPNQRVGESKKGRKFPIKRIGRKQKEKIPNQRLRESKKKEKS